MIFVSKKPDQIPNCYLWYDFSDLSTMVSYATSSASFGLTSSRRYGVDIQDGDQFHSAIDKIRGLTISSYSPIGSNLQDMATRPRFRRNTIGGLPGLSFGENPSLYSTYSDGIFTWPHGYDSINQATYSGLNLQDQERTIFFVYQCRGVTSSNETTYENNISNTTWSRTNLPQGEHGAILSITTLIDKWFDGPTASEYDWVYTQPVSYLNLLKYNSSPYTIDGRNFTVTNYLGHQGFKFTTPSYPDLILNDSNITKYQDIVNSSSLFTFRVRESSDGISGDLSITNFGNFKTEIKSQNQSGYAYHNTGSIGLYSAIISLGSGSRHSYFTSSTTLDSDLNQHRFQSGFFGYIGEFIYYDRKLEDTEVKQVEFYLKKKWSI